MKIKIQVVIEDDDNTAQLVVEEVAGLERSTLHLSPETLGLSLSEAKEILARVQTTLVTQQATQFMKQHRQCPHCSAAYLKVWESKYLKLENLDFNPCIEVIFP
jgi:Zn finger protein HypA/HybF involved in hydrogenase expression